jgi:hypothetical protein
MKHLTIIMTLTVLLTFLSCEEKTSTTDFKFEAEVLGKNSDCEVFAIRFKDKLDQVSAIVGTSSSAEVYIARNLPIDLQYAGLVITLDIRKPEASELGACHALGLSYPWIYVTKAKLK